MQTYLALIRLAIQRQLTYRGATLAGLATNFFFGILRAAVMVALYRSTASMAGMTLPDAITYSGLAQSLITFVSLFGWFEIIFSYTNGQISTDLLKPMSFFGFWLAQDLGRSLTTLLLRGVVMMAAYAVFVPLIFDIPLTAPSRPAQWASLGVSLLLSWLVSFAWRFLINLSAFWVTDARGFSRLFFGLGNLLSGFFMPLHFLPPWLQSLAYLTPFPQMIQTPIDIFLGLLQGSAEINALFQQAMWAVGLILAGQLTLRLGVRKLVIQGG